MPGGILDQLESTPLMALVGIDLPLPSGPGFSTGFYAPGQGLAQSQLLGAVAAWVQACAAPRPSFAAFVVEFYSRWGAGMELCGLRDRILF